MDKICDFASKLTVRNKWGLWIEKNEVPTSKWLVEYAQLNNSCNKNIIYIHSCPEYIWYFYYNHY